MLRSLLGKILLGGAVAQATSNLRQEVAAVRTEFTNKIKSLIFGAIILAFAVGIALFAIGFLALAALTALSNVWTMWLSALVIAGALLIIAWIFLAIGLRKVHKNSDLRPNRFMNAYRRFTL